MNGSKAAVQLKLKFFVLPAIRSIYHHYHPEFRELKILARLYLEKTSIMF